MKYKDCLTIIKNNKLISFLFISSTLFFLWQHTTGISWDFTSYILNAKYIFSGGEYFEWYRPPLMPLVIGFFSLFGWNIARYLYIIFVSSLYLFSCIKFSNKFNIDKEIFYAISITPFFIANAFSVGTELFSLTLTILSMAYLNTYFIGFLLGALFLVRYNNFVFIPLILFTKNIKKIFVAGATFILTIVPWFLFNYIKTGNPLASLMDGYASQVKFRSYMVMPLDINHFLAAMGYLLPIAFIGILIYFSGKREKRKNFLEGILMISLAALIIYSYIKTPYKTDRYIFSLIFPASYFSAIAIRRVNKKITYFLVLISLIMVSMIFFYGGLRLENDQYYINALEEIGPLIGNCSLLSNSWMPINGLGKLTGPAPQKIIANYRINEGYKILLFKNAGEPDYILDRDFISSLGILKETDRYILIGNQNTCKKSGTYDQTYLQNIDELYKIGYNSSFEISLYELIFTNKTA